MKKTAFIIAAFMLLFAGASTASAQSLSDILNKIGNAAKQGQSSGSENSGSNSGLGGTLGNLIEGVFSSSNLSVSDLKGKWTASGPAVSFKADNFLQKAGGVAAAATIESKLDPYYKQYGLTGAVLEVDEAGNFTLKIKAITLKGTISKKEGAENGVFQFTFKALGKVSLGSVTTYVSKSINSMDVMFDSTFLLKIMQVVSKVGGNTALKTLNSILTSYEGLNVGFKMSK